MSLRLYIDAVSRGNPGPAGIGMVVRGQDDQVLRQAGRFLGELTDLEATVRSLLIGLEAATAIGHAEIAVFSSSPWLVRQITGQGHDPGERLARLLAQAQMLLLQFDTWQISHLQPEENPLAVGLADHAVTAAGDVEAPRCEAKPARMEKASDRPIIVRVAVGAETRTCPEPCGTGEVFEFSDVAPARMCLDALAAVLDVVMACRRGDNQVSKDLPLRRPCARPGCGAVFEVAFR
jgi:ribonuclease HI